ncbi:DUF2809 domain-containing protein [Mucilaginibacter panaciglaebae]|uniref:DUF2809 domain-containing protein n=1 Tax=Mucilaginibacter panaciglaebae TaxID=502331 RepID=A0ABP7WYA1_9SPHI
MVKARLIYLSILIVTVIAGLLSRELSSSVVPLFVGDILWGLAVFLLLKFIFIRKPLGFIVIISLIYTWVTEFSQLYSAPWIDNVRQTLFGKLMLGETFLLADIVSYTIGIGLGVLVELSLRKLVTTMYPKEA